MAATETRARGVESAKPKHHLPVLDGVRGFAAVYVLLYHLTAGVTRDLGWWALPLRLGQEAVMIFFVLSGFLIAYSTEQEAPSFKRYLLKRTIRIYPLFLVALAVSAITAHGFAGRPFSWFELAGNVLQLQDVGSVKPGTWVEPFGGNIPLWSLAYEWWIYMMFYPLWRWVHPARRLYTAWAVSGLSVATYLVLPNQLSLFGMHFVLWFSGAELASEYLATGRLTWLRQRRMLLPLMAFACMASVATLLSRLPRSYSIGEFPWLLIRHFVMPPIICGMAIVCSGRLSKSSEALFRRFAKVGTVSYAIYVLHYPLCVDRAWLEGFLPPWLALPVSVLLLFVVAWFMEQRVQPWIVRGSRALRERSGRETATAREQNPTAC